MVAERKRVAGELAAWHVAEVVNRLGLDVTGIENPYEKTKAVQQSPVVSKARFWGAIAAWDPE